MAENKIELKTVKELLDMKFFIPSYQRGYRWSEQQVKDLLNDINEFVPEKISDSGELSWYCLQPLAIAEMDVNRKNECDITNEYTTDEYTWYEVIDGQQRLTTIFIILNILSSHLNILSSQKLSLKYQTRPYSEIFLENISGDKPEAENIDFYFMLSAKKTIEEWIDEHPETIETFCEKLTNHCRVIWYETDENAYEVFKRLNSGKISLSNAELVKALLLKNDNFIGMNEDALKLKQLEMAGEWDRMEQTLHDNSFWYFINPEPKAPRFDCTRIDFLLELILRCKKKEIKQNEKEQQESFLYEDMDELLTRNDYFVFSIFSNLINKEGWEKQWKLVQNYFRTIKSWFDDREKYHYIGYLMNQKGKKKNETLRFLLCNSDIPKDEFLKIIIKECGETLNRNNEDKIFFENLQYGKDNDKIHNILLLFNLATTQNQISENSRYPFDRHFEAARKKWSLEHIHAQNEEQPNWSEEQFAKIKSYLKLLNVEGVEELNEFLKDKDKLEIKDDKTYKAIIGAFMGMKIKKEGNTFYSDFEKDDNLTNLAILQGDKNAALNNKIYPEKREMIAEYENGEKESSFVPICTRNVFFKHYSPKSSNPLLWDKSAGKEYVTAIVKVIAAYLKVDPIEPKENEDFKYGIQFKTTED